MRRGKAYLILYLKYIVRKYISWVLMTGSVLGNILVNMRMVEGQIVWLIAGIGWVLYAKDKKEHALMVLYLIYSVLSIWGIITWM